MKHFRFIHQNTHLGLALFLLELGVDMHCRGQPSCSSYSQREKMRELHKFKRDLGEYLNIAEEFIDGKENMKRIPNNDLMRMGKRGMNKNLHGFNFPFRAPGMGFVNKRAPGMEFIGKRTPGEAFIIKRTPGMEFVGKRSVVVPELVGKRAPGMEFVGKRSLTELKFIENSPEEQREKRPSRYLLDSLL